MTKPYTELELKLDEENNRLRARVVAAERQLAAARAVLSKAVGHEDEPHETLEDCARLLVLDCDAEHDRAMQAEREVGRLRAIARKDVENLGECAGCGDHSCIVRPVKGVGTNGGCRCFDVLPNDLRLTLRWLIMHTKDAASREVKP